MRKTMKVLVTAILSLVLLGGVLVAAPNKTMAGETSVGWEGYKYYFDTTVYKNIDEITSSVASVNGTWYYKNTTGISYSSGCLDLTSIIQTALDAGEEQVRVEIFLYKKDSGSDTVEALFANLKTKVEITEAVSADTAICFDIDDIYVTHKESATEYKIISDKGIGYDWIQNSITIPSGETSAEGRILFRVDSGDNFYDLYKQNVITYVIIKPTTEIEGYTAKNIRWSYTAEGPQVSYINFQTQDKVEEYINFYQEYADDEKTWSDVVEKLSTMSEDKITVVYEANPKTGDANNVVPFVVVGMAAVVISGAWLVVSRKKKNI